MSKQTGPVEWHWQRWRAKAIRQLLSAGIPGDTAREMADGEMRGRRRISKIVGIKAAKSAAIIAVRSSEGIRLYLRGSLSNVPTAKRVTATDLTRQAIDKLAPRQRCRGKQSARPRR